VTCCAHRLTRGPGLLPPRVAARRRRARGDADPAPPRSARAIRGRGALAAGV